MSDTTPASSKKPKPIFNPDDVVEPDGTVVDAKTGEVVGSTDPATADPTPADVAVEEPAVEKPPVEKPKPARKPKTSKTAPAADTTDAAATGTATGEVAPADVQTPAEEATATTPDSQYAGREVVYVQAPVPPKLRGNRGVGSALAVLGAVVFAVLFAAAGLVAFVLKGDTEPMTTFSFFIQNAVFWIPVLVFLVAFVLLVLLVNRAGWAAHVFGSLAVGLVVYFGSIGLLLLIGNISAAATGDSPGTFAALALNPFLIIAALVGREVAIWIGLAIAARGRRVKARNLEIVDEWEREHADVRAQYERAGTTA